VKPLVYIAGPYSHPDPVENTHRIITFANSILDDGQVTPLIPHLTMLWHTVTPRPYEDWLDYDRELLVRCDAIYRFPGESSGADAEVRWARNNGIPVFVGLADLYEWASIQ
jgi:hypothetical protein